MNVDVFDFDLPESHIAQEPAMLRDAARLLVLERSTGETKHVAFASIADELGPGDLLVFNDTKVIPAKLAGRKPSGGRIEMLLIEPLGHDGGRAAWRALLTGSRHVKPGMELTFAEGMTVVPLAREGDTWRVALGLPPEGVLRFLEAHGETPLPPYIRRAPSDPRSPLDRERYQTVYARAPGAIAAPTAGLHFTGAVLETLAARGVETTFLTLHVGPGTFAPVRAARLADHRMHEEFFALPAPAAEAIRRTRARGGRVVAVGTTVARTLETRADGAGGVVPGEGRSGLFIYPGFRFQVVDALVTNFHLPRSTLLMLVCAFAGTEPVLAAYREAVGAGYRFYSYGDAMLVRAA